MPETMSQNLAEALCELRSWRRLARHVVPASTWPRAAALAHDRPAVWRVDRTMITALNRQSRPPAPGDNGNIVKFGHCGSRILKVVLTADEQTIVSVMPVGEG